MTLQEYIQDAHDKIDKLGILTEDEINSIIAIHTKNHPELVAKNLKIIADRIKENSNDKRI